MIAKAARGRKARARRAASTTAARSATIAMADTSPRARPSGEAAVMSPSRLFALPLVLLGLSLAACREARRSVAAERPEADAEREDKDRKDAAEKKADKD